MKLKPTKTLPLLLSSLPLITSPLCAAPPPAVNDHSAAPAPQSPARMLGAEAGHQHTGGDSDPSLPWWQWDHATGGWFGIRERLLASGVDLFGGFTAEVWGNPTGGERQGAVSTNLFDFGVELDLEKLIGWRGATLRNSWFAPLGRDLSAEYIGNHFTVSNAAAYNSLYLFELWFQQTLFDDRASLRLGQLAADEEFAGSDYAALFLNATFGWPPFVSGNLPNVGPAFPKGTPGVRLAITPLEWLTLQSAVYQGDPFADDVNRHGTRWRLDSTTGITWMSELQLRWGQADASALPGTLKLGTWYQSADTPSAWSDSSKTYGHNYGGYIVVDQMLYRKRTFTTATETATQKAVAPAPIDAEEASASIQGLGWFARVATNPQDRNLFGFYFDTGLTYKGLLPGREQDSVGVGFAYGELTADAKRTLREEGARQPGAEMVLEVCYQCQINPWLILQPSVQGVFRPGATRDAGDALVLGARASIAF